MDKDNGIMSHLCPKNFIQINFPDKYKPLKLQEAIEKVKEANRLLLVDH